jgi:hypothetical protein
VQYCTVALGARHFLAFWALSKERQRKPSRPRLGGGGGNTPSTRAHARSSWCRVPLDSKGEVLLVQGPSWRQGRDPLGAGSLLAPRERSSWGRLPLVAKGNFLLAQAPSWYQWISIGHCSNTVLGRDGVSIRGLGGSSLVPGLWHASTPLYNTPRIKNFRDVFAFLVLLDPVFY